jgi:hypothetical protein
MILALLLFNNLYFGQIITSEKKAGQIQSLDELIS